MSARRRQCLRGCRSLAQLAGRHGTPLRALPQRYAAYHQGQRQVGDHRRVRRGLRGSWRTATRTASPSAASTWKMAMCSTACASPCATRRALPCPVWTACSSATSRRRWARTARSMCRCSPRRGDYTVEYTVERGLLFFPLHGNDRPAPAQGRARRGRGQERRLRRKAAHHRTGEPRRRAGASIGGRASTARRPPCGPPSPKRAPTPSSSRARRELTGDQGTYFETYLGSAVLEIRPFTVTAGGWTGVYDGASHGVTLADVDWSSDKVEYAVGSGAFTAAASAAELPAFTDSGEYAITLRVTRENATLDIPVLVRIQPRQITGISAGTVRGLRRRHGLRHLRRRRAGGRGDLLLRERRLDKGEPRLPRCGQLRCALRTARRELPDLQRRRPHRRASTSPASSARASRAPGTARRTPS